MALHYAAGLLHQFGLLDPTAKWSGLCAEPSIKDANDVIIFRPAAETVAPRPANSTPYALSNRSQSLTASPTASSSALTVEEWTRRRLRIAEGEFITGAMTNVSKRIKRRRHIEAGTQLGEVYSAIIWLRVENCV